MKIFITRDIPDSAISFLQKKGFDVKVYKSKTSIPKEKLEKEVSKMDALISLITDKIDAKLIDKMKNCKVIANYAVGFNNIDVRYAKKKNIIVTNTPDVLTDSTADLTMTLALACARNIFQGEKLIRENKFRSWHPKLLLGIELKNKTFGIMGAGRIGTAVAIRAKSFGTKIIYYSNGRNDFFDNKLNAKKVSLNYLLKNSDFISINLPLNKKTHHLINKQKFALMKRSTIIINTARGEIINEKDLINVLKTKRILAAGLDVFENEPKVNKNLLKLKNLIILPHIGSATIEARNKMAMLAAENVAAVLSGKEPLTPV
jgi:glyoxylate reductase